MSNEFILRELDLPQDAEKLAVMWNESDDQWPGTWTGGVPMTAQSVTEWHERINMISIDVVASDGVASDGVASEGAKSNDTHIVGYCSLNKRTDLENTGYLAVLNVHPAYQGRSLGRQMIQRCIDRCMAQGFSLLTIGTWSGNLKSVPLYKKTGFFWVPDTSVYMLNFIPGIRALPCTQGYFSRHDWYTTYKRELKQVEDDQRWEGMKVFVYHWEEEEEALTVWADREAHTLTAVETDGFFAAAIAGDIEPAKGLSTHMRWRLTNKQDRPMSVSLIASGTEHIKLDHRATQVVAPGETVELEAAVQIAADTPDVEQGKPAPTVRTLLIIDGEVLELGSGLKPQKAVDVSTAPGHVTLFPGVAKTVQLQLHSHLKQDVEATVSLAPSPGLTVDWTQQRVSIPARSFAGLPVTLQAPAGGVYPLQATVYFEGGETLPERLAVLALPAGGTLADIGSEETRIENEWVRLILKPKGGEMTIHSVQNEGGFGDFSDRLGPPFWPSELEDKKYTISLRQKNDRVTAIMTADPDTYPGLTLRREVTLGGGPLIEINHALVNSGAQTHQLQLSRVVGCWQNDQATLTVPLKDGIVQGLKAEFPAADEDIEKKPEAFAERWIALTSRLGVLGFLWETTIVENDIGSRSSFLTPQLTCEPQQWAPAGKFYIYAGPGDWQTVRAHARRLAGTDVVPEPISVEAREVYGVRLEPAPLVTVDDQVKAMFTIDNLRNRPLEGQARLALPDGLAVDRDTFTFEGVSREKPLTEEVTVTLAPTATAYEGDVSLQTRLFDTHLPAPVIRLGNREDVVVTEEKAEGQPVFAIDNGRTRFALAPGFCGALTAWEEDGANHVISPFPEQKTFGWMGPWYGGAMPFAFLETGRDLPGKLYQETFTAQAIDAPDERGIPWRGVRLSCDVKREQLVGLQIELDYLTVGYSNVLKLVYRVHNGTTARRHLSGGWFTFWQPDGEWKENVLRSAEVKRKGTPWYSWSQARHWVTVANSATGRTAVLVCPYRYNAWALDWGDAGGHMGCWFHIDVMPSDTVERMCYVALCPSFEEAKRYICLRKYT